MLYWTCYQSRSSVLRDCHGPVRTGTNSFGENEMSKLILKLGAAVLLVGGVSCAPVLAMHHETGESQAEHHGEMDNHAAIYAEHHADDIAAAIAATDRVEAETSRDATRRPAEVLAFSQIEPGSRVMDLGAGSGYMTRLLSSLVGAEGHVTAQNPQNWIDRFQAVEPNITALAAARENVDAVVVEFDDLGVEPGSLDAVTMGLIYHDTANLPVDRSVMNAGIFTALRSGGLLLISDHHAEEGSGVDATDTHHRIDAALVMEEVTAAGFVLEGSLESLRNSEDPHDISVFDPAIRGQTDRFVYLFRKP